MGAEEVDEGIRLAIEQAVTAGVFRRAERLLPHAAETYGRLAAPYSERATHLLAQVVERLGIARPFSGG